MIGIMTGAGFLGGAAFGLLVPLAVAALLLAWQVGVGVRPSPGVIALVVGAIGLGAWRGEPLPPCDTIGWPEETVSVVGTVSGAPRGGGERQMFFLDVESAEAGGSQRPAHGRLRVTAPLVPGVGPGDRVWLPGTPVDVDELPPGFAAFLRSRGACGELDAFVVRIEDQGAGWRRPVFAASIWLGGLFGRVAPGDTGALLDGLVTGRDDALSEERREAFRRTGTSHLTAVSGSNLALLVTIATFSGRLTGLRRRLGWQLAVVAAIWGYAVLAGFEPPVNRAALVAMGALVATRFGRQADVVTLLVLGGAALVAVEPQVLWSLGFQLSLSASLALALVLPEQRPSGWSGWVMAAVLATAAPQLATLPIQLSAFGQLPLLAVPANLIVAPLAGLAFTLAALAGACGAVLPALGESVAVVATVPAGLVLLAVDWLGGSAVSVLQIQTHGFGTAIVAAVCATTICLWSRDGRAWLHRTITDGKASRQRLAVTFGCALLCAVLLLMWNAR